MTQLAFQTTYGRLYTFFNTKWVYVIALFIFEVGSIICALAPTSWCFIIGRAVTGVGASGINSGSLTIGGSLVPLSQKPLYISVVSSMYGVAAAAGPLLGGVFTDSSRLTWRFCFWINLRKSALLPNYDTVAEDPAFGALAILIVCLKYHPTAKQLSRNTNTRDLNFSAKMRNMDFSSVTVLISSLVCLLLALQWGGILYPWSNPRVWGCLAGFACLIAIFAGLQIWRQEK